MRFLRKRRSAVNFNETRSLRTPFRRRQRAARPAARRMLFGRDSDARSRFRKRVITLLLAGLLLSGVGFLIYLIFFSSYFTVQEIVVVSLGQEKTVNEEQIREVLIDTIGKNLVLVDSSDLVVTILRRVPRVKEVELTKVFPRTLKVSYVEYKIVVLLHQLETNDQYLVNEAGLVVAQEVQAGEYPFLMVHTDTDIVYQVDQEAVRRSDLAYLVTARDTFEQKFGVSISSVSYYPVRREVHLNTEPGWEVWLDFARPIDASLKDFSAVLGGTDLPDVNFSVVDLRIPGRVYICHDQGGCVTQEPTLIEVPEEPEAVVEEPVVEEPVVEEPVVE